MKPAICPRAWEAEAIADGREGALRAASFERHVAQCDDCAREAASLVELREVLERVQPSAPTPLEQRRQRAELLRRANERIVLRRGSPRRPVVLAAAAAILAMATVVALVFVLHSRRAPAAVVSASPVFELRAIDGASFRDATEGAHGRVVLSNGSLSVHVEHLAPGQTFVLVVPDGELEVRGTRFIVEVRGEGGAQDGNGGGHTERLLVTEGVVAVRLSGMKDRSLTAGESWTRPVAQPPTSAGEVLVDAVNDSTLVGETRSELDRAVSVPFPPAPAGGRGHRESARVGAGRSSTGAAQDLDGARMASARAHQESAAAALAGSAAAAAVRTASGAVAQGVLGAEGPAPSASHEFGAAMEAFDSGAYLDADEKFSAFAARFPSDARSEDTAFLRAVIATRRGDAAAAVARARDYLRRFPSGLRKAEMERLVGAPW